MKARAFEYVRAASLGDAFAAFHSCAGEARYLAGGQSLLAAMNLRLSAPDRLIDIAHLDTLRGIELRGDHLRIGALTRHNDILSASLVRQHVPLLAMAAPFIAHPAIRNRGTIGGSISLADPASEFPAAIVALGANIEAVSDKGVRVIPADDFFLGLYETALEPGEIVAAILAPVATPTSAFAFDELARRRGDYATAGVAIVGEMSGLSVEAMRIVFFAVGQTPVRACGAERALVGRSFEADAIHDAVEAARVEIAPEDDVSMPGATRRHIACVILRRQLEALARQRSTMGAPA